MNTSRKRVLIVDDIMDCRSILREIIEVLPDFEIVEAATGKMAQERLQEQPFDLVLTDTNMPHGCGIELLRWCVANQPQVAVVIFFSGSEKYPIITRDDLLKMGAIAVLSKPYQFREISEATEQVFSSIRN